MGKQADKDDSIETLEEGKDGDEQQEEGTEGEQKEDRGDEVDPELTPENLKKVAGADEGEEEEEGEGEGGKKPPATVPYSRFKEVNEDVKALRDRLAVLESQRTTPEEKKKDEPPAFDYDAKEDAYLKAVSEGDFDTAKAIRKEIRAAEKADVKAEAAAEAVETVGRSAESQEFAKAVSEVLKAHPFLDEKHEDKDPEAIDEVVALRDFYIGKKGMTPAAALRKAAERVAGSRKEAGGGDEDETAEEKAKRIAKERQQAALKKGADAQDRQPPSLRGKGNRSTEGQPKKIEDMTDEEFEALPEAEKKKARGDAVEA